MNSTAFVIFGTDYRRFMNSIAYIIVGIDYLHFVDSTREIGKIFCCFSRFTYERAHLAILQYKSLYHQEIPNYK